MTRQWHHGTSDAVFVVSSTKIESTSTHNGADSTGTLSPRPHFLSTVFHRAALCAGLFAATGISSFVAPAQAARQEKVVGVPGWTSGTNTYLRVRPGTATPPVAKVPRHTRLYVWGTFNGWYRVETHDGKFGWIYHDYLNVPEAHKLKELSHSKAKAASDRTSHQTLYGSPELLRNYHAQYGGQGAIKGLEKQGIRVASNRKTAENKTAVSKAPKAVTSSPRVVVAPKPATTAKVVEAPKTVAKTVAARPVSTRMVSAPATPVVKKAPARTTPAIVKAETRALPYEAPYEVEAPRVETPRVETQRVETQRRVETPRIEAPRAEAPLGGQMLAFTAPVVESRTETRPVESARTVSEPSSLGLPLTPTRIADARWEQERVQELARLRALQEKAIAEREQNPLPTSPLSVQRALEERRAQEARTQEARRLEDARRSAEANRVAQAKAAEAKAAENRRKAQQLAQQKAAQNKAAQLKAAQSKAAANRAQRARVAAQREAQRQQLRQRMGGASEGAVTQIHPLTPEELLRAREQYLTSRRKTRPTAPPQPELTPSSYESGKAQATHAVASDVVTAEAVEGVASSWGAFADFRPAYGNGFQLVENRRPMNAQQWWTAPMWSTNTTTSAQQKPDTTLGGDTASGNAASSSTASGSANSGNTSTQNTAQASASRLAQAAKPNANNKPAAKAPAPAVNRGGSPRDYARYMQQRMAKSSFGDAVATKALSYRGMPYIFGSASPKRGFDCSGLIYSVLRQRGLNPPRTASGLASYGKPVSLKEAKKGDIILFANTYKRGVSHCGIYLGDGKFVHAARTGSGVRVDSLNSRYYGGKFHSIRRVQ